MNLKQIMDRIGDRVVKDGACLLWTGGTVLGGRPYVTIDYKRVAVRKLMAEAKRIYKPGHVNPPSCGNPLCVNHRHVLSISKSEHMRMLGKIGGKDPKRLVTIKIKPHPLKKLERCQIAEIFESQESAAALARRFGVSGSLVSRVRRLEGHHLVSNPFAGLAITNKN